MSVQIDFQERPSQGGHPHDDPNHAACLSPNPPASCNNNTPDANIDAGIGFLIVVGLIIGIITIYLKRMDNN